jgi:hypothetical protein
MRKLLLACCMFSILASTADAAGRRRAVRKSPPAGPTARADSYSVLRGQALAVEAAAGVLVNDNEPQAKPLTAILVSTSTQGALTLNANGGFTYVHNGSAGNSDTFTYKANNGTLDTAPATVTITITDLPPQSGNDAFTTAHDTPLAVPPPGVLVNDTTNNAVITSYGINGTEQTIIGTNTATARGGSVIVSANGGFTYTPAGNFTGSDTFRYVLTNSGGSSAGLVSVTVTPPAPIAVDDFHSTAQGAQLNVSTPGVLGNDELNGAAISSYGASSGNEQTTPGAPTATAAGGVIRLNADGSFRYDPAGNFTGNDFFKYVIANAGGTDIATVTLQVTSNNAVDFTVISPGFNFQFTGVAGANPVLTLTRGRTYRFRIETASIHPFEILDAPPGSVTNNNISDGILIFAVPAGPGEYRYHCSLHAFGNVIQTTP